MATNVRAGLKITCSFDVCLEADWCPHAVQVALFTDNIEILGKERNAIMLQKEIADRDGAEKAAEGLSMGRGDHGMPPHRGMGVRE